MYFGVVFISYMWTTIICELYTFTILNVGHGRARYRQTTILGRLFLLLILYIGWLRLQKQYIR